MDSLEVFDIARQHDQEIVVAADIRKVRITDAGSRSQGAGAVTPTCVFMTGRFQSGHSLKSDHGMNGLNFEHPSRKKFEKTKVQRLCGLPAHRFRFFALTAIAAAAVRFSTPSLE
ncbi:hypothetical protein ABIE49_006469 [Bradyrhizobium sp. OAE829]